MRVLISPKQSENSDKNESSSVSILQIRLSNSILHLWIVLPRIGTDFALTTIKETLKTSFLCSIVREDSPITGILELLYADNITFTGWSSGPGSNFSKVFNGMTLHWAPVSIL